MTTTSTRRAILAGAATLPVLAFPAMAAPKSDRELLALDRELEAVHARMTEAFRVSLEASNRYSAVRPPEPADPQEPEGFDELFRTITIGQIGALPADHQVVVWQREIKEQRLAVRRQWSAKCKRLMRKCGVNAAEANSSKLSNEAWEIGRRILATRAHTIEGMKIKLRTVERLDIRGEELGNVVASLEKDIAAMAA